MLITVLITASICALFSLYKQFQMLQQNSYFPSRYIGWLKSSYTVYLALEAICFCLSSFLYTYEKFLLQEILLVILLAVRIFLCVKCYKTSIKKLVFTSRIKRLICAAVIILAALITVYVIMPDKLAGEICLMVCLMASIVSPIITLAAYYLTLPVEKAFSLYYVNDAKKILKSHKSLTVIGITGSYGKTTTKFILNRILSEKYNTVCTPHSFNTPMGVVRTVRESIKPQTQIFICEMGAKKKGDIKEICDIVHPQHGIITSVGAQHLDTFKSIDNVFSTKFELYDAVNKNGGGICLANIDSDEIKSRTDNAKNAVYFGEGTKFYADNIKYGASGSSFDLHLDGSTVSVSTRLLGKHSVADILAAAALSHALGVSDNDIKFAISSLKPTEHRLELKNFNGSLLIDDAYNSNPEGCLEAINVLNSFEGMKKTVITPGLIELGSKEYQSNYNLGLAAAKYCDIIILVGKNRSKPLCDAIAVTDFNTDNLYIADSFADAMKIYTPLCDENSVLLIENDLPDNYLN
ncbi:MAG: UDP-N-acetylmuramoyl-tripeptide--D-alanyl-D-alanine ligase [Clostridia bacterium]|nr:UDP-N-acetylmuramoyl-tripeptide--D-alanyl-D-alanine ligase [Clostridia bacterium]